jgi:gamma-glutamyl-gamma-aminobutyrate hydrolase PuuD
VLPLQIPLFGDAIEVETKLENIDGIILTGSYSNIHLRCYEYADK